MTVLLKRFRYLPYATLGSLFVIDDRGRLLFNCLTLEREWDNNKVGKSCVPAGIYELRLEYSQRFGKKLYELKGVPGRSETKFHVANYSDQLEGCIALGLTHVDINHDDKIDITSSSMTISQFHRALMGKKSVTLQIVGMA